MFIIYKATHTITNKFYIGFTSQKLEFRIGQHWGLSPNKQNYFNKFLHTTNMNEWIWETLNTVETYKEARECELWYIKTLDAYEVGLNQSTGANNTTKQKEIASERMRKYKQENPEPWNKGKKGCYSEETLSLMSLAKLKKPTKVMHTNESRLRASLAQKGSKIVIEMKTQLEFTSISAAARHFNLRRECVRDVVNGKRSHTNGHVFTYKEKA